MDPCRTDCAHDGGVEEHFAAAGLQGGALQGRDQVAHVEVDHILQLVRRAVKQAVGARELAACGVLLHLHAWMGCRFMTSPSTRRGYRTAPANPGARATWLEMEAGSRVMKTLQNLSAAATLS